MFFFLIFYHVKNRLQSVKLPNFISLSMQISFNYFYVPFTNQVSLHLSSIINGTG